MTRPDLTWCDPNHGLRRRDTRVPFWQGYRLVALAAAASTLLSDWAGGRLLRAIVDANSSPLVERPDVADLTKLSRRSGGDELVE